VRELVVSAEGELERNSQTLDSADGDTADRAADAEIDHRVLLAVFWCDEIDHGDRKNDYHKAVEQEAWTMLVGAIALLLACDSSIPVWIAKCRISSIVSTGVSGGA